jgi:chaperonin GroEL
MTRNPKQVIIGLDARKSLLSGALKLADTVAVTYGPHGHSVLLDRFAGLLTTKDGVTVAREVGLEDPVEDAGAKVIRQACLKVNDEAGDGTTTTAVLAAALMRHGHKMLVAGHDPNQVVRGIRKAAKRAEQVIWDHSLDVSDENLLRQVALISCNGDQPVADALTEACMAVGKDGTVVIEPSEGRDIELQFKEGIEYPNGPSSQVFLGQGTERVVESPLVAVVIGVLTSAQDVIPMLEEASQFPQNELVLIADGIEAEALTTIVMNDQKAVVKCVCFGASGLGLNRRGAMEDLAVLSGATLVDRSLGHDHRQFQSEWFGSFRRADIRQGKAVFTAYDEAHDNVQDRIAQLRDEMATCQHEYDRDRLRERIAKLQGGMCIVRVGGTTEPEIKERKARIEDALGAVQSALRHGVVAGAGTTYLTAAEDTLLLDGLTGDELVGGRILVNALKAPLYRLLENAHADLPEVLADLKYNRTGPWIGWDARQGIRDLSLEPMIIDPTYVSVLALQSAVSVAGTLLTAEASITPKRPKP